MKHCVHISSLLDPHITLLLRNEPHFNNNKFETLYRQDIQNWIRYSESFREKSASVIRESLNNNCATTVFSASKHNWSTQIIERLRFLKRRSNNPRTNSCDPQEKTLNCYRCYMTSECRARSSGLRSDAERYRGACECKTGCIEKVSYCIVPFRSRRHLYFGTTCFLDFLGSLS